MARFDARMLKPFIRVHPISMKPLNMHVTRVKPHLERRCNIGIYKDRVNIRRVNAETHRVKMQRARFIPASKLVANGKVKAIQNPYTGKVIHIRAS